MSIGVFKSLVDTVFRRRAATTPLRVTDMAVVLQNVADAIVTLDARRRVILFNTAAERMYGCPAAKAMGRSFEEFIPERCHEVFARLLGDLSAPPETSLPRLSNDLYGTRQSVEFPLEVSVSKATLDERPLYTLVLRDIAERRRLEQSLRESETRFHVLFDTLLEGCQLIGYDWRYLYINESAARNSRSKIADRLGKSMLKVFPGVEKTERFKIMERCMYERIPQRLESRVEHPDGSIAWLDVSMQPAPDGVFILAIDITERKLANAALERSGERLRQIADSLPQLIWTAGTGGVCDFTNRQWQEYTGLPYEAHAGHGWLERVHPDDRSRLMAEWGAAAEQSEFHSEARLQRHDGAYRWFDVRATSLRDESGRVTMWFCSNTDIDERRRAGELQLRSQKMEALGTLAGGIAHDFNNILLAIKGNTRLAIEDLDAAHPTQESLSEIERASTRATELVRRILSFSRQEESKRVVVHLQSVLKEAVELLRVTLPAMIQLRLRCADGVPSTIADASQAHQIVMNLVTNAAHAIGRRAGVIEIILDAVQIDAEMARTASGLTEGRYVRLTVSDNGSGMDRATLDRIFDPFFTTKPAGQGTGLGLSVVDGIMKNHGGVITVYSQLGKGTSFRLYFPASEEDAQVAAPQTIPLRKAMGQRVLYVDDDQALVLLATRTLGRLGYQVTGFNNPSQALDVVRADPSAYDVVVTDLSMPIMSGTELTRRIREIRADIPIIITSGYLRPEDHEHAAQLGAVALMLKPNTVDEMGQLFDRLFREGITAE